jgi:release factor glutamine methyltransferase
VIAGTPVRDALDSALVALTAAGVDSPRLDAELLLAHVLGVDRARLVIDRDLAVAGAAAREFQTLVRRRAIEREPVAYLLGTKGFRHIDLEVDPRVLIPRPETELLVEVGLTLPRGASVVDVGTGSGAVALALKSERPDLVVRANDISEDAIDVARDNARRLALEVSFSVADLFDEPVDAVLSNPPYVSAQDELPPEVARHEPHEALFAGGDGLDVIRRLFARAGELGVPLVAVEHGMGQAALVAKIARSESFASTEHLADLAGIGRVVVARR